MARKRKPAPEAGNLSEQTPLSEISPGISTAEDLSGANSNSTPSRPGRAPRVILHFDAAGRLDLSRMDPDTRGQLESAFRAAAPAEKTDPALVGMVLTGIGQLEAAILAGKFGMSTTECREIVGPSEPLLSMLSTAGARVVDKHNLTGRWGDEIALAALLCSWQAGILQALKTAKAAERGKPDETRDNMGPAPAGKVNPGLVVGIDREA